MTKEQNSKCAVIVHSAAAAAGIAGAGLAQLPCSDSAAIVPIQVAMVISIGAVFGVKLSESAATSTLGAATATMIGRGIAQVLVGWIPGLGNALSAVTASGVTEIIGWAIAENFARGKETKKS